MILNIDEIFNQAVALGASDVHLSVGYSPIFRIDGDLKPIEKWPKANNEMINEVVDEIISKEQKEEFERTLGVDFSYNLKNGVRVRVSVFREKGNLSLAGRIILPNIPTMEEIMMPKAAYDFARSQNGLILVTGPAGCGKSTSLAAMIDLISKERAWHIITLEDPIEYVFPPNKSLIAQRELGRDMKSFADGMKRIVRQDPNVIMVGEMRDLETISSAVTLAETGHLVISTLHTPDAFQTVSRIIDVFPAEQQTQIKVQLSISLKGVIAQKLLPKKNGGLIAAREVLVNTPAVAHLIRENKIAQIKTHLQTGAEDKMFTLDQDIKKLYKEKLITKETAVAHMVTPSELEA